MTGNGDVMGRYKVDGRQARFKHGMPLPSTCSGGPRRPWIFEMEADHCHESSQNSLSGSLFPPVLQTKRN
ncbi:hypothetical protein NC652_015058 [Populus alba x Populus x berolinensis]|uniref:Uncharacterized protein n=1 Tax=Populus alba x Populus x berolinensis TaxID=444605 RepID=A0AAD6W4I2_9ROSI|nr:hypothetical protein NC652_015058 [Populus alba x Populus x berolinensis]KAJ6999048.1 hypothetical protein NC653_015014 [Populus alba x Populus x berolinensis]